MPKALHELLPVLAEVIRPARATAHPDVAIVVVQGFLLDVLVLACHHFVAQIQVLCRLLERHRFDITLNLVVKVAQRDRALAEHHVDGLRYGAGALVFELLVDREGDLCLGKFISSHFWVLLVIQVDDVPRAVFEAKNQTRLALIAHTQIFFADEMFASRCPGVQIAAGLVCLNLIRPVVDLDVVRWVEFVDLHREFNERTEVEAIDAVPCDDRLL